MAEANPSPENVNLPRLGSYQILRSLGSGGMSNVFQAVHEESKSVVALKVLPRKLAQNAVLLQRFLKEAKSAEILDHPNIVAIYDRGFDQGRHYLVLEYVEGRDLFDRVRLNGVLTPIQAVKFVRQVALGLQYAARLGMIHRDVKPANVLMTPEGQAKIIDLGLAFQTADEDERVTRDGTTVGTVDYMSPEQARDSRKINERSDIYSLGCTLHYLLTGSAPYPGGNLADKLARHHSGAIPDVRDREPNIPADLACLVQKMMAKKPEQRFTDYNELIAALDQIGSVDPGANAQLANVLIDDSTDDDDEDYYELSIASGEPSGAPNSTNRTAPDRASQIRDAHSDDPESPEISLADLAALDSIAPSASSNRRGLRTSGSTTSKSPVIDEPIFEDGDDFDEVVPGRSGNELPLQTWIAAGIMVGLLIAVVGFGVRFALSFAKTSENVSVAVGIKSETESSPIEEANSSVIAPSMINPARLKATPPVDSVRKSGNLPGSVPSVKVEPHRVTIAATEPIYSKESMARLGISTKSRTSILEPTTKVVVRRLLDANDPNQTTSLANAFGRGNDLVEIADLGPFHEDDYIIAGKSRIIRGTPGLRPILKIEDTQQILVRGREAKFILGLNGVEQLTLEGVDLVVDVRDLPLGQSTLFLCQGADLTLRDCTITVTNAEDRRNGFSIFRLANGPRPNRLRIERTLIRGPIQTLAQVVSAQAEIELDRSVVVGSSGALFQFDQAERSERSIQLHRSVLLTRGSAFVWNGKPGSTSIRSLGTTFSHVETPSATPLMVAKAAVATDLKSWLDYDGEANRWIGWESCFQSGSPTTSSNPVRESIREIWPNAETQSSENPTSWSSSLIAEKVIASDLATILPESSATLKLVAEPHPFLLEMTVDLFPTLTTPDLLDDLTSEVTSSTPRQTISLNFGASSTSPGDLGKFLFEQVTDSSKRYVIRVQGSGSYPMSPVRLPDGVSVVIAGPPGEGTANPIPVFTAAR